MWPITLNCPSLSLDGDVRQVHTYNIWRVYTLIWRIICCWKAFISYIDSWSINYLVQMHVNCYQNPVFVAIYTLIKAKCKFLVSSNTHKRSGEILSNETEAEKTTQPSICSFTKTWRKRLVFPPLESLDCTTENRACGERQFFNMKINTNSLKAVDQHP